MCVQAGAHTPRTCTHIHGKGGAYMFRPAVIGYGIDFAAFCFRKSVTVTAALRISGSARVFCTALDVRLRRWV